MKPFFFQYKGCICSNIFKQHVFSASYQGQETLVGYIRAHTRTHTCAHDTYTCVHIIMVICYSCHLPTYTSGQMGAYMVSCVCVYMCVYM